MNEILRALPPGQLDAYLTSVYGDRNTVRVVKRERQHGRLRSVSDELRKAIVTAPALLRLDELRVAAGLEPRHWLNMAVAFNLRTNAGIDYAADSLGKSSSRPSVAEYIAVTTDSTTPAAGDTTLATEITTGGLARAQATYAHTTTATSYTLTKAFSSSATFTNVQKAGLFTASSAGILYLETAFTAASLISGDTLTLTWTINI